MARPRLFSFFNRAPDASAFLAPPVAVAGITSEPPDDVAEKLASVSARLESVIAERDQAQAKFAELETKFAEQASKFAEQASKFGEAQAAITALTTERDTLKAESERTREDLTQELRNHELATLAASQGIPAGTEIVPTNGPGQSNDEQIEALIVTMKAERDPVKKGKLCDQIGALREAK